MLYLPPPPRISTPIRCSAVPPPTGFAAVRPKLDEWLEASRDVKCPFWRRRFGDTVSSAIVVCEFVGARHKSLLDRQWLPGSDTSLLDDAGLKLPAPSMGVKTMGLPVEEVMAVVRRDFEEGSYYVSGKLSQAVYDDACFFDGPDPDFPVRSLQRYSDALSGLFDPEMSSIELVAMEGVDDSSFVAHWRLSGHLKLPWRPAIKPYAGATRYELNSDGLICSHTEAWSISAVDAFVSTAWEGWGPKPAPPVAEHVFVEPPAARLE